MKRSKKIKIEYKDVHGRMTPMLTTKETERMFDQEPLQRIQGKTTERIVYGNYPK